MKKAFSAIIALLLFVVAAAQSADDYREYLRMLSRIEVDSMQSDVLTRQRQFSVYLPPRYEADTTRVYPVLYLLHGAGDDHNCWAQKGGLKAVADRLIASGEIPPMVIITPNAWGRVGWEGYFDTPDWEYETFFFTEFMPEMERRYRIGADKSQRAIAGLSMGGGGATSYAQRHPDQFSACYAMSALMDFPANLGPGEQSPMAQAVSRLSCVNKVKESDDDGRRQLQSVDWFVDCGDDDFLLEMNLDFYNAMRHARIPCQLRVRDGGHDWEYWHMALYTALPFVARSWTKQF